MPEMKETKDIECPKCKGPAKETITKKVELLDFGHGPVPNVYPIKKEIKCAHCILDMAGDIEERYQDDD